MKVNSGGMSHGGKGAVEEGSEKEEGGEGWGEGVIGVLHVMKGVLGMGWPTSGQSTQ